jgi:predicted MFS family arabinose efflux permease
VAAGEAGANPASQSRVAELFPERQRTRALGVLALGPSIGIFFGLFLGGWIATHWNWRAAFFAVGAPGVLLALVIYFTMGRRDQIAATRDDAPGLANGLRDLWAVPTFRYAMLALGFHSLAGYAWTTWAPTFMMRVHPLPMVDVGLWLGLATALGVMAGTVVSAMLADRLGRTQPSWFLLVPAGGAVLSAIFAVATALASTALLAILCYVPMVAAFASWAPTIYALAQALSGPRSRALAAAMVGFFSSFIGTGFGPMLVGILNDKLVSHGAQAIRFSLLLMVPAMLVGGLLFVVAAGTAATDFARRATSSH